MSHKKSRIDRGALPSLEKQAMIAGWLMQYVVILRDELTQLGMSRQFVDDACDRARARLDAWQAGGFDTVMNHPPDEPPACISGPFRINRFPVRS